MKLVISLAAVFLAAVCLAPGALAGTVIGRGSQGPSVTQLQQYLHANKRADMYPGAIGSHQWNQLQREAVVTRLPGYISRTAVTAARASGWAVDASKSPSIVTVLHSAAGGSVQVALSIPADYGGYKADDNIVHTTYDGVFRIYAEYPRDFVSHEYNNAPMPYAACFNGGQCLHYDGLYPSHGCVHIPSWSAARYINRLPIGTTVVVHG